MGTWGKRLFAAGTAIVLGATVGAVGAGAAPGPAAPVWPVPADLVPGTATTGAGVLTVVDYVYDDDGAGGDFSYPSEGAHGNNAADVAILQIRNEPDAVGYRVGLNTLLVEDSTVVALAVDTDGDEATGGGPWPLGADITTAGWDHVVTIWGSGGVVTDASGSTTDLDVVVDLGRNTMTVSVPHAVAAPGTSTWRYRGASGLWDADAGTWAEVLDADSLEALTDPTAPTGGDGSTTQPDAFNLLFRSRTHDGGTAATDENDSPSFQSAKQAAALDAGDLGPFFRDVDFGSLGTQHIPAEPPGDVHITRLVVASDRANTVPEGVSPNDTFSTYNGIYQPYRVFVPDSYRQDPTPAPMLPMLHGWTGDHRGFNPSGNDFWQVMRDHRAIVPKPLGRGQAEWYEAGGEVDVLDVIQDVRRRYAIDPDRIFLGGTSMGGLGTIKVAEAHPDLFAGILPSVPPMSPRTSGYVEPALSDWDLVEHVESLHNVPARTFIGTYDPLVPVGNDPDRFCNRLAELSQDHDCWRDISSRGTHRGYENDRAAEIDLLLSTHVRDENPARVIYEVDEVWAAQAAEGGVSDRLPYDSAYWVSAIDAGEFTSVADADHTAVHQVDVTSHGRGTPQRTGTPIPDDPDPELIRNGLVVTETLEAPAENRFDGIFTGILAADLDLSRMALSLDVPLTGTLDTDVPLALGLIGEATACHATLGDAVVPVTVGRGPSENGAVGRGRVDLAVPATDGPADLVVSCTGAPPPVVPELPVAPLAVVAALAAIGLSVRRRRATVIG